MRLSKHLPILSLIILVVTSCSPDPKNISAIERDKVAPSEEGYSIIFTVIADHAMVYLDDSLVYDGIKSPFIGDKELLVDLSAYNVYPNSEIKVNIFNVDCGGCPQNKWQVVYELYKDGEGLDYVSESSNEEHADIGLSFAQVHQLSQYQ